MRHPMLARVFAAVAVVLATTFSGPTSPAGAAAPARDVAPPTVEPAQLADVLGAFGDHLGVLHELLSYEPEQRDAARIDRVCTTLLAYYPTFKTAVGDKGTDLLVAAESMVDACRGGFAVTLDTGAFEIIDGDYITFRELSFDLAVSSPR